MRLCAALSFCVIFVPSPCDAWGNLAHRTIALLAQKYFTQDALEYTRNLLGSETIDSAAIWADEYKQLPEGRNTGSWHFVDARDDPPDSCSVDYHRDCQSNRTCIIDAIQNTTSSMIDTTASPEERTMALKFILHLIGDIHCPLHAESIARGGNDVPVLYEGEETNLHFAWDVAMPRDVANGAEKDEVEVAKRWAEQLYNGSIKSPDLFTIARYSERNDIGDFAEDLNANESRINQVMDWAREANAVVCTVVLPDGVEATKNKELSGSYFKASAAVIERQIFLAGFRLGMWINVLVANGTATNEDRDELR
ncbi:nuclease S1 [Byssothecium circinans]|uniref:Nuclease S1 n=1 Tax=Byssothecium circinans TaxID=147558 RepID=A0A6A5UDS4_9PLEO|nr:nuclease S1 [Byssothecium circinans]